MRRLLSTSSESIWRLISAPNTAGGTETLPQSPVSRSSSAQRLLRHGPPEPTQSGDPRGQVGVRATRCVGEEGGPDVVEALVERHGRPRRG